MSERHPILRHYLDGRCEAAWAQLSSHVPNDPKVVRAVALETMRRVRSNVEVLQARWRAEGFEVAPCESDFPEGVSQAAPLGGEASQADLDDFEKDLGRLPLALRAFCEVVGGINFMGRSDDGYWAEQDEGFDPLQVEPLYESFAPRSSEVLMRPYDLELFADPLTKFDISGVGAITVDIPGLIADPVLRFEGGDLKFAGQPITFLGYLRLAILKGGGVGPFAEKLPDPALLQRLTRGLISF